MIENWVSIIDTDSTVSHVAAKGAFTPVPQVDQHGWINQSEPCKQFLSTEVINGVDGWTSWRWPTFVQRRLFTLGDSPQINRINRRWLTTYYPYQQAVTHHSTRINKRWLTTVPVSTGGDSPQYPYQQASHDLFPIAERVERLFFLLLFLFF